MADRDRKGVRLAFVGNDAAVLASHRGVLIRGAAAAGFDVHAIVPDGDGAAAVRDAGATVHLWRIDRKGQQLAAEIGTLARLAAIYRRLRPSLVHHVTIKPVLYGSLVARATRIPAVVNAVTGLGYVFLAEGAAARLRRAGVVAAYRAALATENSVCILQNDDDEAPLRAAGALGGARIVKIRGSGVDLQRFAPSPEPAGPPLVVLAARLLSDKGVREFAAAARSVRARRPDTRFALVGPLDPGNPAAISGEEIAAWQREGLLEWWGMRRDMPEVLASATVVCLPSYREGLPKVLIEAAAVGRAIVTTDVPGCRDAVDAGRAGLLVPARDAAELARALERVLDDHELREALVRRGAQLAAERWDERAVLTQHLDLYASLLYGASARARA